VLKRSAITHLQISTEGQGYSTLSFFFFFFLWLQESDLV
jgi:hypothetical protein